MRILRVHNYYQQPGGEDQSFAAEIALLEQHGHEVLRFTAHNDAIKDMNRLEAARKTVWNGAMAAELRELLRRERPQLVHFENTFPLISPAAYYAVRAEGLPVVQSLRNYRLFCANAYFFRDGVVCEECLGRLVPWPAVAHACYRDSRLASGAVAALLVSHRLMGTWQRQVDRYVALTEFGRQKFIEGGLPADKIVVKPNFVTPDPGPGDGAGGYALFVGRLSPEKGVETLLKAWEQVGPSLPLKVVGDGPLRESVEAAARTQAVEWLGQRRPADVLALMKQAHSLIFPSGWYEGFPRVIVEAFAVGLPVIASNIGSMASLIEPGRTGLHVRPGDAADLARAVLWAADHPAEWTAMRSIARGTYLERYTAEQNYRMLMAIYEGCIEQGGER
jgi:glycosyltransferase involved in cell wall biosynthesis